MITTYDYEMVVVKGRALYVTIKGKFTSTILGKLAQASSLSSEMNQ
jgi:hypothetical protein